MFQLGEAQEKISIHNLPANNFIFYKKNIKFMNKEQLTQLKEMLIRD